MIVEARNTRRRWQIFDGLWRWLSRFLTSMRIQEALGQLAPNFLHRIKCTDRCLHDVGGAHARTRVGTTRLDQLGVDQDDAQMVVEAVEEFGQCPKFCHASAYREGYRTEIRGPVGSVRCAPD